MVSHRPFSSRESVYEGTTTKKVSYSELSIELDKFFFLPFGDDESPEMRAEALEAYLKSVGWTWDDVLNAIQNQTDSN